MQVHKAETEESFDILRWLDRKLIQLCQKFAGPRPGSAPRWSTRISLTHQTIYPSLHHLLAHYTIYICPYP